MEYLVDTHTLLWYLDGHSALPQKSVIALNNASRIVVSIVSLWEITIKSSLGKLDLNFSLNEIKNTINENQQFKILDISFDHLNTLQHLLISMATLSTAC